jgi:hypothetical protein
MHDFDPVKLPDLVFEFGSRAALVATGSTFAALSALIKTGDPLPDFSTPAQRFQAIRSHPEASALFDFSISDALPAARQKAT